MAFKLSPKQRLAVTIAISLSFFVAEITVAFMTKSLALLADAFHYMNDLISFLVALVAIIISERSESPKDLSFGWQRAQLLGAFFNGVFLLALGISIFLQSIERFISIERIEDPIRVLIMGCVGLGLNILSASVLHEHGHDHHGHSHDHHVPNHGDSVQQEAATASETSDQAEVTLNGILHPHAEHRHHTTQVKAPGKDLGMRGVLIHVLGDAINNVGVIIAALVIAFAKYDARYYADPGVSLGISLMILFSSLPLLKNSGVILLQSAPRGVDLGDVKHDLEQISGIESVHELHVWRLNQTKAIATAHVVVSDETMSDFMGTAKTASECLHAYGIHSVTLQPEQLFPPPPSSTEISAPVSQAPSIRRRKPESDACQVTCGKGLCENLTCCTAPVTM